MGIKGRAVARVSEINTYMLHNESPVLNKTIAEQKISRTEIL